MAKEITTDVVDSDDEFCNENETLGDTEGTFYKSLKQDVKDISLDKEKNLWMQWKNEKNQKARDKLTCKYLVFVYDKLRHKVKGDLRFFYDIMSPMSQYIMDSMERYDPNDPRNALFTTYFHFEGELSRVIGTVKKKQNRTGIVLPRGKGSGTIEISTLPLDEENQDGISLLDVLPNPSSPNLEYESRKKEESEELKKKFRKLAQTLTNGNYNSDDLKRDVKIFLAVLRHPDLRFKKGTELYSKREEKGKKAEYPFGVRIKKHKQKEEHRHDSIVGISTISKEVATSLELGVGAKRVEQIFRQIWKLLCEG